MTELNTVVFDIETTGFETSDQLAVIDFDSTVASRVFLNTDGTTATATLEAELNTELTTPFSFLFTIATRAIERDGDVRGVDTYTA
ncbi:MULTISPECIES: hypothetical protein [unclassified Haloferax]|uniref:hypothetical protein n=1 Tax=unclassified Haloferax TaxID=2625095 RepID=UPI000E235A12|nr:MULTISPECIES: hypothetical protein [unclassified Haloferax]RDZ32062.1 hypothetical protein C5B88_18595 [Haloferax sp. Atlit-24N]RLM33270.1 hypothetical protein DVK03_19270 [Haloferax sp. Atlit-109R]RLM40693.1 hypothetical protein DVK04_19055 [Haloferax sp. Atlit-105R]